MIVGNWKMNGSRESVRALLLAITASETLGCDRMVCPPFVFMDMAAGKLDGTSAFMSGKLKIQGDMGIAMKLAPILS